MQIRPLQLVVAPQDIAGSGAGAGARVTVTVDTAAVRMIALVTYKTQDLCGQGPVPAGAAAPTDVVVTTTTAVQDVQMLRAYGFTSRSDFTTWCTLTLNARQRVMVIGNPPRPAENGFDPVTGALSADVGPSPA